MEVGIRIVMALILFTGFGISGFYRRRATAADSSARRSDESRGFQLLRLVIALPGLVVLLGAFVAPSLMSWATFDAPAEARWLGVPVAALGAALAAWLFPHLGSNVTATTLLKDTHSLVTSGPYLWIRHPLYAAGLLMLLGTGLALANALVLVLVLVFVCTWMTIVIPREEAQLAHRFGEEFEAYKSRTGALLPRL